jgi:transposase
MSRHPKNLLRLLEEDEKIELEKISRSHTETSIRVARAKAILAVSQGHTYREAAILSGRKSDQAVSQLVCRFNHRGLDALNSLHGGGPLIVYGAEERRQILETVSRPPIIKKDGTASWSLTTLQAHLKKTSLGHLSTYTIWKTLHEAGYSFQKSRTWVNTGKALRKRKEAWVMVEDPDKEAKKKSDC